MTVHHEQNMKREDQQDATIICLLFTSVSTCFGHDYAMITKADKGKTVVIIYTQDYNDKVQTFLSENNFCTIPKDHTNHDCRTIQKTLQQCEGIIYKKQIKFLIQKNPTHTQRPVKTTQTKHPHNSGSEKQKRPSAQNCKMAEHHPKQPPTPGQTLQHHQLQHPGQ